MHSPTRRWSLTCSQSNPHSGQRPSGGSQLPRVATGDRSLIGVPRSVPPGRVPEVPLGAGVAAVRVEIDPGVVVTFVRHRQRVALGGIRGLGRPSARQCVPRPGGRPSSPRVRRVRRADRRDAIGPHSGGWRARRRLGLVPPDASRPPWIRRRGNKGRARRVETTPPYGEGGDHACISHCGSVTNVRRPGLCHHGCMAKTVIVKLTDDIDGGDADETVRFSLDGKTYEIDLNAANAAKLRSALQPYIEYGRATGGATASGPLEAPMRASPRRSTPSSARRRKTVFDPGPIWPPPSASATPASTAGSPQVNPKFGVAPS